MLGKDFHELRTLDARLCQINLKVSAFDCSRERLVKQQQRERQRQEVREPNTSGINLIFTAGYLEHDSVPWTTSSSRKTLVNRPNKETLLHEIKIILDFKA